jgi:oxygen-dependent protoporphyrinogen oxidase
MAGLVDALVAGLEARGVELRLSSPVEGLSRDGSGWAVTGHADHRGDAVVVAVPAPSAATLLRPHDDEAAALLASIDYASVTLVTFRVAAGNVPESLHGTGFLVPRHSAPKGGEPWAVTACTFLDRKWPHLGREEEVLLRASLGRIDDTRPDGWTDGEAAQRAWDDLGGLLGVRGAPEEAVVARHPDAFPQYRVHHLLRIAGVEAAVARLGGVAVAGAAYHGVGIPACIASGRTAARALL